MRPSPHDEAPGVDSVGPTGNESDNPITWEPSLAFLKYTIASVLIGALALLAALRIFAAEQVLRPAGGALACVVALLAWYLLSRGRIRATINVLTYGIWLVVTGVVIFTGGLRAPAAMVYPMIILMVGWLINLRGAAVLTALTLAVVLGVFLSELSGALPAPLATPPALHAIIQVILAMLSLALVSKVVSAYSGRLRELQQVITERNRVEDDLRQSEARYRDLSDNSSDWIWSLDLEGRHTYSNNRVEEILGVDHDEFLAADPMDLVHPDDRSLFASTFADAVTRVAGWRDIQIRWRTHEGDYRTLESSGSPILDSAGHLAGFHGVDRDITERKEIESALTSSELRFRSLLQHIPSVAVQGYASDGTTLYWNKASEGLYGYSEGEAVGRNLLDLIIPAEMKQGVGEAIAGMFATGEPIPAGELSLLRKDGSRVAVFSSHAYVHVPGQEPEMFCVDIDLSERKRMEEMLLVKDAAIDSSINGIALSNLNGELTYVNEAFCRMWGISQAQALGRHATEFWKSRDDPAIVIETISRQGRWVGEMDAVRPDGQVFTAMVSASFVSGRDGKPICMMAAFTDITAIKEHQLQLEHIAHYDALTTLPNRVLLADRLHQGMAQAQRREQRLAVAYVDLDRFKAINDLHGHDVGDQLLMALAARMKQSLREGDTLARLGGDEFVAVLVDLPDVSASAPMLTRLLDAAAQEVQIGDLMLRVSASLGVTFFPQAEDVDGDQLLRQADQAMYQAKLAGKNRYHVFDSEQDRNVRGHHESLERIRHALVEREFVLYFQPKVNMRSGAIIGAEALVRWRHPEKGLLSPAMFLPVIEDHPLAIELGEWVIGSALAEMERWHSVGLKIPVSVNVGARQLQHPDFVDRLRITLMAHPDVQRGDLELEVLETSALEDLALVSQVIEACRVLGVCFSLDDFGTGYSSLTYLKRLPVTLLKIDQSFVRDMLDDPDDLAILDGIIGLSVAFRRQVIAEGVETAEIGAKLLQLGCDLAQGFCIARPMPGADLPAWAASWRRDLAWGNFTDRATRCSET